MNTEIPVIALVGRPNVGKSTLFNQLTRSRDALVADYPGLTRDRQYGEAVFDGQRLIVIDTGGLSGMEEGVDSLMASQAMQAVEEADRVLLMVDGRAGLTAGDQQIVDQLRRTGKQAYLVVNKTDGQDPDQALTEFYGLGFAEPFAIAAAHNRGVRRMLEVILEDLLPALPSKGEEAAGIEAAPENAQAELEPDSLRIGVVGRPNVGKSTLVNRMLGEERVVVFDLPGTTRDSITIPFERRGRPYTLIDTAGVRRRKHVREAIEKFSIIKTLQAIEQSHVVVMVVDAREGLVEQDLHLIGFILEAGRGIVVAINKWDGMAPDERESVRNQLRRRMAFLDFARVHFISALHGSGVGDLFDAAEEAYDSAMAKWSTNRLTEILRDLVTEHQPPMVRGRRIKLRYAHQGGSNPPIIVVHGNQTDALPAAYRRYLENRFRTLLGVRGTPLRFEFRSGENPFAGKSNPLSERQKTKRARMIKHIKKREKQKKKR